LQELLIPARLKKAMEDLDTDSDGTVSIEEWEEAIEAALQVQLNKRAAERARRRAEAKKERDAYTAEVLVLARQIFAMLDEDESDTLSHKEIVDGVQSNDDVIKFLMNCGNADLAALLRAARFQIASARVEGRPPASPRFERRRTVTAETRPASSDVVP